MEQFLPIICKSALFSGVEPREALEMLGCLNAKNTVFRKGQYLIMAGESASALGLVLSGRVLIIKEDFWGNRNIIASAGPGQCFAETFASVPDSTMSVSVVADTEVRVLFLNVRHILTVCSNNCAHHNRLIRNLLAEISEKNLAFTEKLSHLGQRTTRAKLLSYLSGQAQKNGSVEFDIPFSRQELADYLFVERSGLSMELSKMRNDGLLDYHKNHFILKHDPIHS